MARKVLALTLLAMSLAAPGSHAQTAPAGTSPPAANAVDPASIQALKDMGAYLQSLNRFRVTNDADRRARSGRRAEAAAHGIGDGRCGAPEQAARAHVGACAPSVKSSTTARRSRSTSRRRSTTRRSSSRSSLGDARRQTGGAVRRRDADVRPVHPGHAGRAARQDRVGDECRPGLHRRATCATTTPSARAISTGRSGSATGAQAAAAQARDHQPRRRGASAVGLAHRLEPEAVLQ